MAGVTSGGRPCAALSVAMLLLTTLFVPACALSPGRTCDGLEYTQDGIDARRYLPH